MLFYLDDDDHKPVDFEETITFTCQMLGKKFSILYFMLSNEPRYV